LTISSRFSAVSAIDRSLLKSLMLVGKSADPIEHWFRADQQQALEDSGELIFPQPQDDILANGIVADSS
jgi:hypothetical protein